MSASVKTTTTTTTTTPTTITTTTFIDISQRLHCKITFTTNKKDVIGVKEGRT